MSITSYVSFKVIRLTPRGLGIPTRGSVLVFNERLPSLNKAPQSYPPYV